MSYVDKSLACRDCGAPFSFTAGEQEFYAQKGFTNEPSRCPARSRVTIRPATARAPAGGTRYAPDHAVRVSASWGC